MLRHMFYLWRVFLFILASTQTIAYATESVVMCSAVRGRIYYTVQAGDHLSGILQSFGLDKPLWDIKSGSISKVSKLNQIKNPNLLFPGMVIELPFGCEEKLAQFNVTEIDRGREVRRQFPRRTASNSANDKMAPAMEANPKTSTALVSSTQNDQNFKAYSRLRALGRYDFLRIDSKSMQSNSTALLLSEPAFGLNLGWEQVWSDQFSTDVHISYSSIQMRDASSGTLIGGNKPLGQIGFGVHYFLTPALKVKLDSNFGNQLFARAIAVGTATLDSVYLTRLSASVIPTLFQSGDLSMDLQLGCIQVLPGSTSHYSIKSGSGYLLAPTLRQKLDRLQMELKLNYEDIQQHTSISNQQTKQVGIQFGLSFELGN